MGYTDKNDNNNTLIPLNILNKTKNVTWRTKGENMNLNPLENSYGYIDYGI